MPMKIEDYPDNWKWLSAQVRKRNGGRCELCNAPNGEIVLRPKKQYALDWDQPWYHVEDIIPEYAIEFIKTKIILTVHHIDGDKSNNSEQNLISLCQRDHLRLDLAKHMRNRKRSRQLAREGK